jgi:membrane-bound lytic murein transglycosylase D
MTTRGLAVLMLVAVAAGCTTFSAHSQRTAVQPGAPAPPAVTPALTEPPWRQQLGDLLDGAGDAANAGDAAEFRACELVAVSALARLRTLPGLEAGDRAFLDAAVVELQRLAEEFETASEEAAAPLVAEEVPPEPKPVPEAEVVEAREKAEAQRFDLPVVVNAEVTSLIDYYTGPYRDRLIAAMQRGGHYLPFIRAELRGAGLPEDLAYLPLVESAFNTRARSRARAQGMWQFMKGTAALYGLRADGLVDERNDPYLATQAAVAHLADLHAAFNDWELALAAYNSGAGRVERAMRRSRGGKDFWSLRRHLPRETRNYVPAFWAALVVAKNPQAYGLPPWLESEECVGRVPVDGALDLDVLAERIPMSAEVLAGLNPALVHRLTSPRGTYRLAVPCGDEEKVAAAIAAIPQAERVRRFMHTVQRGDTLGAIARRYGSSVDTIVAANRIRNVRSLKIGQTLVIPRTTSARSATPRARQPERTASLAPGTQRYVVRRGDTLYDIARRFGTSVDELRRRNGLSSSRIMPGDVLVMP